MEWVQCVWPMLIICIHANGNCSLMDNSQMSNLLNQSRLKVLKARDDMIVVSGHPLRHTRSTGLHSHRKHFSLPDLHILNIICSKYPYLYPQVWCIACYYAHLRPKICIWVSHILCFVCCICHEYVFSSPWQSLTLSCLQVELMHMTETGLSCHPFLQLFSCSLWFRGIHSGWMYVVFGWLKG